MASYIADFFLIPQGTYIHVSKWPAYLAVPHTEVLHGHQLWDYTKVLQYMTLPSHMTQRGNSHILVPHPSSLPKCIHSGRSTLGNHRSPGVEEEANTIGASLGHTGCLKIESMGRKPKYLAGWLGTMIEE